MRNVIEQAHPSILFAHRRAKQTPYPKKLVWRVALALGLLSVGCGEKTADPIDAAHPSTEILGELDPSFVDEASGLAISRQFPDRLYHHNDSGGGPYFYITSFSGENTQTIEIEGYDDTGQDLEDMALGPCEEPTNDCIYLANIGDNFLRRESIEVLIIEEQEQFGASALPVRRLKMKYPDSPHNAEGLAVDPLGSIYILTKGVSSVTLWETPSRIYRLARDQIWAATDEPHQLELVGEIDLPALAKQHRDDQAAVATAFDISPDGERYLILTRRQAYEFQPDLSEHRLLAIPYLSGQEAVAYLPDGSGFIYTQEFKAAADSKIIRVHTR